MSVVQPRSSSLDVRSRGAPSLGLGRSTRTRRSVKPDGGSDLLSRTARRGQFDARGSHALHRPCASLNDSDAPAPVPISLPNETNTPRPKALFKRFRRAMARSRRAVRTRASSSDAWYSADELAASKPRGANPLASALSGVSERMEADRDFLFKLVSECSIDQVITLLANITAFGPNPLLWSSAALASAMLLHITAILNDIVLVYCLAPVPMGKKGDDAPAPKIAHCFQPAEGVTAWDRVGCWVDKFKLYAVVGAGTALLGGVLTLLIQGQPVVLDKLWRTLLLGSLHLGVSANTRYQLVNGLEVLLGRLPRPVARAGTVAIRMTNNFLGARTFLLLASVPFLSM